MTDLSREDQKRMWSAIDFLASLGRDGALATIAMATHAERPEWPLVTIFDELGKDMRDLHEVAHAASTAARSTGPNRTKHPAGIRTTFPGADDCTVCAQRANAENAGPPRVLTCDRCGKPDGINHYCATPRPTPTWHERRRELATHYGNLIAVAKRAHDWDTADLLRQQWSAALSELNTAMATHIGGGQ